MKNTHILKTIGLISALSISSLTLISCDGDSSPSLNISEDSVFPLQAGDLITARIGADLLVLNILSATTLQADDGLPIEFSSELSDGGATVAVNPNPNLDTSIARLNEDLENPDSVIRRTMAGEVTFPEVNSDIIRRNVAFYLNDEYNLSAVTSFGTESPSGSNTGYLLELFSFTLNSNTSELEFIVRDVEILTEDTTDFEASLGTETVNSIRVDYTLERSGIQN